jgi:uncharacterized membrane protein YbhN (UPF0104 family)
MTKRHWQLLFSGLLSLAILMVAFINREELRNAFGLMWSAEPRWLFATFGTILFSYFVSSQVFAVVLRSLGYRLGAMRLWATALVAIIISQSIPAGGVGSYAFLVGKFIRHGVPSGKAALIASLEVISYICAMLLIFGAGLVYLWSHSLGAGWISYLAAAMATTVIGVAMFLLTRPYPTLKHTALALQRAVARCLRRTWSEQWVLHIVDELVQGRRLINENRRSVGLLVVIQIVALSGHSLAMLMVLASLGVHTSFWIVLTAFGIALITSSFNVLPGGGGTVEAALIAVLVQLGVGAAALPTAILFRLINFWLLTPIAALAYYWLMHEKPGAIVRFGPARRPRHINAPR